jgi:hypothetical protein
LKCGKTLKELLNPSQLPQPELPKKIYMGDCYDPKPINQLIDVISSITQRIEALEKGAKHE